MRPRKRLLLLVPVLIAGIAGLWPADALAQRRGAVRHAPVRTVVVGAYGGPISPYYYDPFFSRWYGYQYGPYPPYARYGYEPATDLRVQVTPREAEVYLDGYLVGNVDDFDGIFQRLRVPFGEHTISIYREGFRTITERMLFRPYESYHLKQAMEPLAGGAAPEPRPVPEPRAAQGPPDPRVARAAGQIERRPEPRDRSGGGNRFGSVAIRVQPRDAAVMVDGERWSGPAGQDQLLIELSEGTHRVDIRKDGFQPYTSTVRIQAGQTEALNVSLPADR